MKSKIAVVEGKWFKTSNVSVSELFNLVSDIYYDSPHHYYYEMFTNDSALHSIIENISANKKLKYLHVGAHGSSTSIESSGGTITRAKFRNALRDLKHGSIRGMFIDSCSFTSTHNARFFLKVSGAPTPITWLAGFGTDVDFVASSTFVMLFWTTLLQQNPSTNELPKIIAVAKEIKRLAPGLCSELDFHIFVRQRGRGTTVEDLMS